MTAATEPLRRDNVWYLEQCLLHGADYLLIDDTYEAEVSL